MAHVRMWFTRFELDGRNDVVEVRSHTHINAHAYTHTLHYTLTRTLHTFKYTYIRQVPTHTQHATYQSSRPVWCGVIWCDVVWCDVVWCDVVWCDVVWCDVVWCDVVWCDVVWCGVVWVVWVVCGVVCL